MDELHAMLASASDALSCSNPKDAYFGCLDLLDALTAELRKIKFIGHVAISSAQTVSVITLTRSAVCQIQDILGRHNAAIAAITDSSVGVMSKKSPAARLADRVIPAQARTVAMLTERLQASSPQPPEDRPRLPTRPPPLSPAQSVSSSPIIYSPLVRSSTANPPKPTRRPPPSPPHESQGSAYFDISTMDLTEPSANTLDIEDSPILTTPHMESNLAEPLELETYHQPKPPLPPKPAGLFRIRRLVRLRSSNDLSADEDDSDDDEEPQEHESPKAPLPSPPVLHRKMSSPGIAIPSPWKRFGPSVSVPVSPSHSPPNTPSSCPSSHGSRSFSQTHYSVLRQNSGLITVIPEGCIDPANLIEAERINGDDDEDQLDHKTYGPSDHIPLIPVSPLRTTHRTLVEKEKSWSSMLVEAKRKMQEDELSDGQIEDDGDMQTRQEDIQKYTAQIGNVMATITKVRELLYRSASITSILEFPPHLVAYQLTLVESAIFLQILPTALLVHSPKTPHRTITASTDFFNYLTRMIEYSILYPPEASGRAQSLNYWVKVAVKLHELENFQTLKAVLSALGTPPIKRLKRTWSYLPKKSTAKLETLSELMSENRNYGRYREMMVSLSAGTILPSAATSPVTSDASSGKFDILGSWSSADLKVKENIRRPMVPFLGTFIMDITYLLAAVKKGNSNASSSPPVQVPATSSLRGTPSRISVQMLPQNDPRVQDLLNTLSTYQSGPRYSPQPSRSYIKASVKAPSHFRAPSLSSALQITSKYRTSSAAAAVERDRQMALFDDDDDDMPIGVAGNGGMRATQQLILHYILTRPWVPEKMADELSTIREPVKTKNAQSPSSPGIISHNNASWTSSTTGSSSSWTMSTASSSLYSPRGSMANEEPRPISVEEE